MTLQVERASLERVKPYVKDLVNLNAKLVLEVRIDGFTKCVVRSEPDVWQIDICVR